MPRSRDQASLNRSHLRSVAHRDLVVRLTSLQNEEIWTKKFRRFRSDIVELTAVNRALLITDTDSVLYTLEDRAVLQIHDS